MLNGLKVSKDSGVIVAPHELCGWSLWTKGLHFVYLASVLIFYTSEKYLREKTWNERKSFLLFRSLSTLSKVWRSLLQELPGTFYLLVAV